MFINWEEEGVGIGVVDVIVEADVDEVVEVLDVDKDDEVIGTDVVVDCENDHIFHGNCFEDKAENLKLCPTCNCPMVCEEEM